MVHFDEFSQQALGLVYLEHPEHPWFAGPCGLPVGDADILLMIGDGGL